MSTRPARLGAGTTQRRFQLPIVVIILLAAPVLALGDSARLTSAVIRGSSIYAPPDLFAIYRPYLGRPIDRELASAVVTAIADRYVQDGYARPRITVDDELVTAGILRVDVFETRLAGISITGDPGPYRDELETLTSAASEGSLLRRRELQAMIRRMNALSGLSLSTSTAQDAAAPDSYRLEVDTDFDRITGSVRATNRGTDEVGPNFLLGQITAHGIGGSRTHAGALFSATTDYDEYRGLGFTSATDIGADGASFTTVAFRSRSRPDETPVDRDLLYVRDRVTLGYARPVVDRTTWRATLAARLELEDLEIDFGELALRDERLRMLELALNLRHGYGERVQYAQSIEIVKGLDGLGSGLDALDLAADPRRADFLLARATFIRLAQLNAAWSWRIDAFAQQSAYTLPYSQRFKIGGDRLGRGFEVTEIAGDQGAGAKLELRRRLGVDAAASRRLDVYGFYDIGATWKQNADGRESAATTGIGVSMQSRRLRGSLELAQPLTHTDVEGSDGTSIFVELSWRL